MTEGNEITITAQYGILMVRVACANLADQLAQSLAQQLTAAAEQSPTLPVLLDLSQVTSMPSMSIGGLVTLWKKFQDSRRRFILAAARPQVRQTLAVCRLDKLFELSDSVEEARLRLRAKPEGDLG